MDKWTKYVSAAMDIILTLIVFLVLSGFISGKVTGNGFNVLGFKPVHILSASMEPTIMTGALIIVMETDDYAVGDIIMYESGSVYIVHRYIGDAEDGSIITKGDNNQSADIKTHMPDEVYGKAVLIINQAAIITGSFG